MTYSMQCSRMEPWLVRGKSGQVQIGLCALARALAHDRDVHRPVFQAKAEVLHKHATIFGGSSTQVWRSLGYSF